MRPSQEGKIGLVHPIIPRHSLIGFLICCQYFVQFYFRKPRILTDVQILQRFGGSLKLISVFGLNVYIRSFLHRDL